LDSSCSFVDFVDFERELKISIMPVKKSKGFKFPPKEELEKVRKRIARPGYRRVNIGLLPDATEADKVKYHLCKSILAYEQDNNVSEKELRNKLGINQVKLEHILFAHISKLTIEELINCLDKLPIPCRLKTNLTHDYKKTSPQAH
jgi:predicted XRE-type DNA-binding protein